MFTGIVAELGEVVAVERREDSAVLTVEGDILHNVTTGESVAVNGVCLTAVTLGGNRITADVIAETLRRSALDDLRVGDRINLERPVTPTSMLGGHVVQGHVDGIGVVADRRPGEGWDDVFLEVPRGLTRYIVEKGSITLDGVSLTVVGVGADWLSVSLIPETLRSTTMGFRKVGDRINIEVDVLAKYVEKLLGTASGSGTAAAR